YNTAFIYDVLCGLFYFAAFAVYVRTRRRGESLSGRQIAGFLVLFLCSLNSKEMAVSLPAMLIAYEWIYHRPTKLALGRWPAAMALSAALTLLYLCGRFFGSHALARLPGYVPVFSLDRVEAFQRDTLRDLLFLGSLSRPQIAAVWALISYLVWRRNRPLLRFCWVW